VQPRILFAGNGAAACRSLDLVLEATSAERVLVLAPPHGPHHSWQESLAERARTRDLAVIEPRDVNELTVIDKLRAWRPDIRLSVGYTQLFSRRLLEGANCPFVNFHPSLLPRHRGVAPLVWAMAEGDTMTGVTAHLIDSGVDTGPVLDQLSIPIHPDETGYELHLEAAHLTSEMCARILRRWLRDGELPPSREQEGAGSPHRTRDGTLNEIVVTQGWKRIRNVVRALHPPFPGATLELAGRRVLIGGVEPLQRDLATRAPGSVQVVDGLTVFHTGDEPLAITHWYQGDEEMDGTLLAEALGGSRA
jgi:methionyl-tRNA formyltransferase